MFLVVRITDSSRLLPPSPRDPTQPIVAGWYRLDFGQAWRMADDRELELHQQVYSALPHRRPEAASSPLVEQETTPGALFVGSLPDSPTSKKSPSRLLSAATTVSYAEASRIHQFCQGYVATAEAEELAWRHFHWTRTRALITAALARCQETQARRDRFAGCGAAAWIFYSPSQQRHFIRASYCHDRFCDPCGQARSGRIVAAVVNRPHPERLRFITLTLAHYTAPLREQIQRLRTCFRRLRESPLWTHCVSGGIIFLEVCRGDPKRGNQIYWHPHLHIIAEGQYIDDGALKRVWRSCTGDSYIVDIRACRDEQHLAAYACKYSAKPLSPDVLANPDWLDESISALRGVRMAQPFGAWYHLPIAAKTEVPADAKRICSLPALIAAAKAHEPWALAIFQAMHAPEELLAPGLFDAYDKDPDFWELNDTS